jgi:hypothetical protein
MNRRVGPAIYNGEEEGLTILFKHGLLGRTTIRTLSAYLHPGRSRPFSKLATF